MNIEEWLDDKAHYDDLIRIVKSLKEPICK